eukprot:SAG11_NODE_16947_length_533_cov_0.709677_1_plen_93_part_00
MLVDLAGPLRTSVVAGLLMLGGMFSLAFSGDGEPAEHAAWAHAYDQNCCGGGGSCGYVYCHGTEECVQAHALSAPFETHCAPSARRPSCVAM